jgi:hypothetical protein
VHIIKYHGQDPEGGDSLEYGDIGAAVMDAKKVAEDTGKMVSVYQLVRIVRTETKVIVENPPPPPPRVVEERHGIGSQS